MAQHPFTTGRWLHVNNHQENENWHIARNKQNEVTSFCYVPNKEIKSIFLGTFPIYEISEGDNDGNIEFFYGSCDNKFWSTLKHIFQQPINTASQRIDILQSQRIGITDILLDIDRIVPNINLDNNLSANRYNDLIELISEFPSIKNIFITSGKIGSIPNLNNSNKSVATWFKNSLVNFNPIGFDQHGFKKQITVQNINFNLIYLFSPSKANNLYLQRLLNENKNFNIENFNVTDFRNLQWEYFIKKYHLNQPVDIPQPLINFFKQ
jgi:G:T/U-mismatch repair DNA glycosylase